MCAKTDLRRPVHGLTNTDVRIDTYTGVCRADINRYVHRLTYTGLYYTTQVCA